MARRETKINFNIKDMFCLQKKINCDIIKIYIHWRCYFMCKYIKELCGIVYDREIDCKKLEDQILAQKTVYLLETMGVYIGDYSFNWCKYGPYSLKLQDDILNSTTFDLTTFKLSDFATEKITILKKILANKDSSLKEYRWMELVASLHFIKNYISHSSDKNEIFEFLKKNKSYFSDDTIIDSAYRSLELIII